MSATCSGCTATTLQEKRAPEIYDEVGQRSLERLFPGFTEDSSEQASLGASQTGIGFKRTRDIADPAHLGALIAAKPRILAMMPEAVTAGLLPKQPLVTRLGVVEAATTANLEALDGEEKATGKFYIQKAAQAADEAWQQTVHGHNGPTVTNPRVSESAQNSSASQDDDGDDSEFTSGPPRKSRLGTPQLQAQLAPLSDRTRLRRLKNTLHSKGAWQQVTRIEDLCRPHVSHKWLYH